MSEQTTPILNAVKVFQQIEVEIDQKKVPKLKNLFRGSAMTLNNLKQILIRKSLIKEDKYRYESTDESKFFLPEEKNFTDLEAAIVLNERLEAFENSLNYIADNIPKNIRDFDEKTMNNMRSLLNYFAFHGPEATNVGVNTRVINGMIAKLADSKDTIAKQIAIDSSRLLKTNFTEIKTNLEDITRFQKEVYKYDFRTEIFGNLPKYFTKALLNNQSEEYLKQLQLYMKKINSVVPYNVYWIEETVRDCYETELGSLVNRVSKEFLTTQSQKKVEKKHSTPREKLFLIVQNMAFSRKNLESIYIKISLNLKYLSNRKKSFLEAFQDFIQKSFLNKKKGQIFEIEYIDPKTKLIKIENIDISQFLEDIKKRITLYNNLVKPTSNVYIKVKSATEKSLYDFMDKQHIQLCLIKERLVGLESELKHCFPKSVRDKFKSFNKEIKEFNSLIDTVTEQKHNYIKQEEQFKKTGQAQGIENKK